MAGRVVNGTGLVFKSDDSPNQRVASGVESFLEVSRESGDPEGLGETGRPNVESTDDRLCRLPELARTPRVKSEFVDRLLIAIFIFGFPTNHNTFGIFERLQL